MMQKSKVTNALLLKTGSLLLMLWGLFNGLGGSLGASDHPSGLVPFLFGGTGLIIVLSGVGFWTGRSWASLVAIIGLLGLSMTALYSAYVLRGWTEMNLSHHLLRLAISALLFGVAALGRGRTGGSSR